MGEGSPASANHDALIRSLIGMAVESWRIGKVFERMLFKLDPGEQNRYRGQFRWFHKKVAEALAEADLQIVNLEGQPFDPGMAATPLNLEEFATDAVLVVDQMLEPVIMGKDRLVKAGTVTLKRMES
jgi:hypothetical protein